MYKGIDISALIFEGEYHEESDIVTNKYYMDGFAVSTNKALSKCNKYIKNKLLNAKQIIGIRYAYDKRYEKSFWWKIFHKRFCKVEWIG